MPLSLREIIENAIRLENSGQSLEAFKKPNVGKDFTVAQIKNMKEMVAAQHKAAKDFFEINSIDVDCDVEQVIDFMNDELDDED